MWDLEESQAILWLVQNLFIASHETLVAYNLEVSFINSVVCRQKKHHKRALQKRTQTPKKEGAIRSRNPTVQAHTKTWSSPRSFTEHTPKAHQLQALTADGREVPLLAGLLVGEKKQQVTEGRWAVRMLSNMAHFRWELSVLKYSHPECTCSMLCSLPAKTNHPTVLRTLVRFYLTSILSRKYFFLAQTGMAVHVIQYGLPPKRFFFVIKNIKTSTQGIGEISVVVIVGCIEGITSDCMTDRNITDLPLRQGAGVIVHCHENQTKTNI